LSQYKIINKIKSTKINPLYGRFFRNASNVNKELILITNPISKSIFDKNKPMKKLFLSLTLVLIAGYSICQSEPKLKFTTLIIENNAIPYGADYSFEFPYKNISKDYVQIVDVKRSCGCTTPYFAADSIQPGKKDKIVAKYDTKRVGSFTKSLTVEIKGADPIVLTIKGTVLPESKPAEIEPKKD